MSGKKGLLSICCTCYNHEHYIKECIDSIWQNSYKNIEIIVIDDGSKDNSVRELKILKDKSPCRFEIITQENTHNIGLNINRAFAKCNGEFVTFMSCDDKYTPTAFIDKINLMKDDSSIAFTVSNKVYRIQKNGKVTLDTPKEFVFTSDTSIDDMCEIEYQHGSFAIQGNIFRSELIKAVNGFDEDICGDDIVIRTKILQYMQRNSKWKFRVIDTPAFMYRIHNSSLSQKENDFILKIFLDCYDRYWNNKPYPNLVTNIISNFIIRNSYKNFLQILKQYPRVLDLMYHDDKIMFSFYASLHKKFKKKTFLSYVYRKDFYNLTHYEHVFFNFIKIKTKNRGEYGKIL